MTNRLELDWKLDGFVDEQRYYCSETPIDPLNLPAPKDVLDGDVRTYTDTAVEIGKTYNIIVSAVKNGIEKLSDEIEVYAGNGDKHWDKVAVLMHFNSSSGSTTSFYEEKHQVFLPRLGSTYIENGGRFNQGVFFGRSGARAVQIPASYYALKNKDFTIEVSVKFTQLSASSFYDVFGQRGDYSTNQSYAFYYTTGGKNFNFEYSVNGTSMTYVSFPFIPSLNVWYDLMLVRNGDALSLYINNVLIATRNLPTNLTLFESTAYHQIALSAQHVAATTQTSPTWFDELRVTIGVARNPSALTSEFKNYL